jgi:hypothetical protein
LTSEFDLAISTYDEGADNKNWAGGATLKGLTLKDLAKGVKFELVNGGAKTGSKIEVYANGVPAPVILPEYKDIAQ